MPTKILIAGATGTNGRELIRQLELAYTPVRALVRNASRAKSLQSDWVELVEGDLANPSSLEPAFSGIERAYIAIAIVPNTIDLFNNFFTAAKLASVQHLVKLSGLGSSPHSPYEAFRQHGQADALLRASGLQYTILQSNSFFQNLFRSLSTIRQQGRFYLPMEDAQQSLVDFRDVAKATAIILSSEAHYNQTYELTGSESLSFYDVAQQLSQATNRSIEYIPVSVEAAKQALLNAGMSQWDASVITEIQRDFATGQYARITNDLERLLEHRPTRFADFAFDHAEMFKQAAVA